MKRSLLLLTFLVTSAMSVFSQTLDKTTMHELIDRSLYIWETNNVKVSGPMLDALEKMGYEVRKTYDALRFMRKHPNNCYRYIDELYKASGGSNVTFTKLLQSMKVSVVSTGKIANFETERITKGVDPNAEVANAPLYTDEELKEEMNALGKILDSRENLLSLTYKAIKDSLDKNKISYKYYKGEGDPKVLYRSLISSEWLFDFTNEKLAETTFNIKGNDLELLLEYYKSKGATVLKGEEMVFYLLKYKQYMIRLNGCGSDNIMTVKHMLYNKVLL
ncbi:hypothetical protein [Chitinophaga sp. Cy-1792]|uniref:hypothetical protein n=1 Tax=Chitinophaga sp. Cy-1792 TaxID=2608339 RepID=UPI001423026A|nr:hypothetical protein [Chitinophaga sp. Cy-1792]NIG55272.1 hypothetical protein [Chitinophaga sp. Cy-1792]